MREVIELSHKRSESYGIDRVERNNKHFRLSAEELAVRRERKRGDIRVHSRNH